MEEEVNKNGKSNGHSPLIKAVETGHVDEIRVPKITGPSYDDRVSTSEIKKLINLVGVKMAPEVVKSNTKIDEALKAMGLPGSFNDCIVARLYSFALLSHPAYAMKAMQLLMEINNTDKGLNQYVINFITPKSEANDQKKTIELKSDQW